MEGRNDIKIWQHAHLKTENFKGSLYSGAFIFFFMLMETQHIHEFNIYERLDGKIGCTLYAVCIQSTRNACRFDFIIDNKNGCQCKELTNDCKLASCTR